MTEKIQIEDSSDENEEREKQKALEQEYLKIRQLPHKVVNGIPILLTKQEIEEFNRKDPDQYSIDLDIRKDQLTKPRKEYLKNTDWYVTRESDQPNSYPSEIKNKRIQAREEINTIQLITDLQQLESFTTDFQ